MSSSITADFHNVASVPGFEDDVLLISPPGGEVATVTAAVAERVLASIPPQDPRPAAVCPRSQVSLITERPTPSGSAAPLPPLTPAPASHCFSSVASLVGWFERLMQ
jgi:hypothetical protein